MRTCKDWKSIKPRFVFILSFVIAILFASHLQAASPAENTSQQPSLDFETYRRNVDDIFRIYLTASPNVGYGVNDIIVELNRKIQENPENPESIMNLAHIYRILGQPAEANRFYQKALKLDPNNLNLRFFSLITNLQSKKLDQALEDLNLALEKNPADIYARMARGRLLMIREEYKKSASDFKKVLQIQPENRTAAFALSLVYQSLGQKSKAFKILQELRRKNPKEPFVRYHLGALLFANEKYADAVQYWEGLFNDGVRDMQFLLNLSAAYIKNKQDEKAKIILDHMSFFFPREIDVDFLMAETYRQMKLYQEAERRYRYVLVEDPYYTSASLGLSEVLERQGKRNESRNVLTMAEESARELTLKQAEAAERQRIQQTEQAILNQFPGAQSTPASSMKTS